MKRLVMLVPALALMFGMAGCIQMKMDTTINKDGSGTFSMVYGMSPSVAEALKEMDELGGMGDDMPNFTDIDKAELEEACKKNGVTLRKFEEKNEDGAPQVTMILDFKDIEGFNKVMGTTMGEGGGGGMMIFKTSDGNYMLKGVDADEAEAHAPEWEEPDMTEDATEPESSDEPEEFDPEKMQKSMEIMGKLMASSAEMEISMRITVPGSIVSSNAMRTEGNTAIWEINAENMMTASAGMDEPEVVFSGKGLKISAPDWEN